MTLDAAITGQPSYLMPRHKSIFVEIEIIHIFARSCAPNTHTHKQFSRMDKFSCITRIKVRFTFLACHRRGHAVFSPFFFICRCCRRPSTESNTLLAILSSHVSYEWSQLYRITHQPKQFLFTGNVCTVCWVFLGKMSVAIRRNASNQIELKTKTTTTNSILRILPNLMDDKFDISPFFVEHRQPTYVRNAKSTSLFRIVLLVAVVAVTSMKVDIGAMSSDSLRLTRKCIQLCPHAHRTHHIATHMRVVFFGLHMPPATHHHRSHTTHGAGDI